ncbi:xanthine dehydrogenase family protein subunit M [Epidermidibacterium keratini]|uniref:Xanthine dehydrogenase family protein subunit M n=1 Tax=Epidermidibacterium keratini TaxID=1891644 RepID=A0A7L4YIG2_9ACTN|nr:xanthine dehydrogenase family protein subunit M [Epidermidibacterium keratini]QHB98987.1 xanthine dehydrogenase family protein subunit M [Epidermidibacterium keratini]
MKPAPFDWYGPTTTAEAVDCLAKAGSDGKVLAGGQSLIPMLAMRLAEPKALVDLNAVRELSYIRSGEDGVRVGALTRHAELERHADTQRLVPIVGQGLRNVAHATIRNRGTTVGSIAHADPSGEMTSVLALTGGHVVVQSAQGSRTVGWDDFFVGALESCLQPGELAVEAFFPAMTAKSGSAYVELSRRHGDYAMCGVGAIVEVDESRVTSAKVSFISVTETPIVIDLTDAWNEGAEAAAQVARESIDPVGDIHASAEYRTHLAGVLAVQAIGEAIKHAKERAA